MQSLTSFFRYAFLSVIFLFSILFATAQATGGGGRQQLRIRDFVIWGGSSPATTYNAGNGVFFSRTVTTTGGIIGSNHLFQTGAANFSTTSNIVSGNKITLAAIADIGATVVALNTASAPGNTITAGFNTTFGSPNGGGGNILAKGAVVVDPNGSTVNGRVSVPAPTSTNYSGPPPAGGLDTFLSNLPILPIMPSNHSFNSGAGIVNNTITLSPKAYAAMTLNGDDTVTFSVPGTYIFSSINNTGRNAFIFNFDANPDGKFNIYVVGDALMGELNSSLINFGDNAGVFMEVHGTGAANNGYAFDLRDAPIISQSTYGSNWIGTVWAPFGGINIQSTEANPTAVSGSLWSATRVLVGSGATINYRALSNDPNYIDPYYPPPPGGKVDAPNNKIGAELFSLSQNAGVITTIPANVIFRFDATGTKVMIEVIATSTNYSALKAYLVSQGYDPVTESAAHLTLTGFFPINKLTDLNAREDIDYVRPMFEPIVSAGQTTTQGDTTMRSHAVRDRFNVQGEGVKIGVLSDSYNTLNGAQLDVDEGDLPGKLGSIVNQIPVSLVRDFPFGARSDEGRAMLQIVHDVAPKATLAFRSGFISPLDFALGIKELANAPYNCNVITEDITYITEPFLRDGLVAQAVNDVVANKNVSYFTSAGNFGTRSNETVFVPSPLTELPGGAPGVAHAFGGSDIFQTLSLKKGNYVIAMQWDDDFYSLGGSANTGAKVDMDIYLIAPDGSTLFGFNRNNIGGDPIEVTPFVVNENTEANLMIVKAPGSASVNPRFKYIIFRGDGTVVTYNSGSSTIVGQANADSAIAVAAMLYANVDNVVPDYPSVATFSSRGGTTVNGTVRLKPELTAPNGVNTTVNLGGINIDDDAYYNFFGTSAAAPHAAAVAALLIEAKKKFDLQPTVTPATVRGLMQSTALDLHTPGHDVESGYGSVQADNAILTIANARPIIEELIAPSGLTPSQSTPFVVRVKGQYLNTETKVYLRGAALPTVFVNSEEVRATIIPPINDDPPVQLYNPPKSPSGLDGGLSEALFFFSVKKAIVIKADNKTKKYGEANPAFTSTITVDGVPIASSGITLAELKLDGANITYTSLAMPLSGVANYSINPSRTIPLDADNPVDANLLLHYTFTFTSGTLTIQKLPVKITPKNMTVTYGEYVGGVKYDYVFTGANPSLQIQDSVKKFHKQYLSENTLAVVNGFNTASPAITTADLQNMSIIASYQSARNARKYILEGGRLKPITTTLANNQVHLQRFLIDVSAQSLNNFKTNPAEARLVSTPPEGKLRGLLSLQALAAGTAKASLPNGQLQAMVNGQLLSMVNGQLLSMVNGQLQAMVNGSWMTATDIVFENGQLLAMVNGEWKVATNGQLQAVVNGATIDLQLSVVNGQLQAMVNGQLLSLVNGQLQAVVNGQLLAVVNGQLMAAVNGGMTPLINGQLMALVNGQLQAVVNGQLMALVNGELVVAEYAQVLPNGQLQAMVNGVLIPINNGQLQSVVNGQLLSMVNGQLMAVVNGDQLAFVVFQNGQLQSVVNGQLQAVVNGQLQAMVNGVLMPVPTPVLVNGQLQSMVNGQLMAVVNGQLQAVVNGQLQAMVNGEFITGSNNSKTAVIVDGDDISLQGGALGGQFSVNMITGLTAGSQKLIPGALIHPNFEVSYGMGDVTILPAPLVIDADWKRVNEGAPAPAQSFYSSTIKGLMYTDAPGIVTGIKYTLSPAYTGAAGVHIIKPSNAAIASPNYFAVYDTGRLYVNPYKNGAKKITVKRECVRLATPTEKALYGYSYVALFSYENKNNTPFYIPRGTENRIVIDAPGTYRNALPEVFEPGNHANVMIYFSGNQMYWEVFSINSSHKTATTSSVNAGSGACNGGSVAANSQQTEELAVQEVPGSIGAYPNPARDRIIVRLDEKILSEKGVTVIDASGRSQPVSVTRKLDDAAIEVSVSGLKTGVYLLQVKVKDGFRTVRFVKL